MKKVLIAFLLLLCGSLLTGCELFMAFRILGAELENLQVFALDDEEILGQWVQDYDVEDYFYEQDVSLKHIYPVNSPRPVYEYYQIESEDPISFQIDFELRINEKYEWESIRLSTGRSNQTYNFNFDDEGITYSIDGRKVNVRIITPEFSASDTLEIEQIACKEIESNKIIYASLNDSARPGSIRGVFIKIS